MEVAPNGPHDHLTGVQADSDLDWNRLDPPDFLGVPFDRFLHPQRRVAGTNCMVLVGERRAEERHDPIAHHLIDRPLVAVDGLHHPFEHRIEDLPRLLGIAVGEELHGALQVGKQHGDLLALALEGALGREDLLDEVLGGVALGRGEAGRRGRLRRSGRKRRPATIAKLAPGLHFGAAVGADGSKRHAALSAESCTFAVLGLAPGTLHAGPPDSQAGEGRTVRRG